MQRRASGDAIDSPIGPINRISQVVPTAQERATLRFTVSSMRTSFYCWTCRAHRLLVMTAQCPVLCRPT